MITATQTASMAASSIGSTGLPKGRLYVMILMILTFTFMCPSLDNTRSVATSSTNNLRITAWNMRGFYVALPYLYDLLELSDVVFVSEHHLYQNELYKLDNVHADFDVISDSSSATNNEHFTYRFGNGGIAMFFRKSISQYVCPIRTHVNDRVCGLKVIVPGCKVLYIIGVYLPQQRCTISSFDEHLDNLQILIDASQVDGEIIILGDTNCHLGAEVGPRGWGDTTQNAKKLVNMMKRSSLTPVDMLSACSGPNYTYYVEHIGRSYIDHIIISCTLHSAIKSCNVFPDCVKNSSDHLPVHVTLAYKKKECHKSAAKIARLQWDKITPEDIKSKYSDRVDEILVQRLPWVDEECSRVNTILDMSKLGVDYLLDDLVRTMTSVSMSNIPQSKPRRNAKPYWSKYLSHLSFEKREVNRAWHLAGRPRDTNNPIWINYKLAKAKFRKEQRLAQLTYETKQMEELCTSQESDAKWFWSIMQKRRKKKRACCCPILGADGTLVTDPHLARVTWGGHFSNLHVKTDNADSQFQDEINTKLNNMAGTALPKYNMSSITVDLIRAKSDRLKLGKAGGVDGITPEHVRYAGPLLIRAIHVLFSAMTKLCYIPPKLKRSVIVPIPKGHDKDLTRMDNYRGISLLPTLSKLYENVLLPELQSNLGLYSDNCYIDQLQGAVQKHCSSLDTAFLVREVIAERVEHKKKHICCVVGCSQSL